MAKAKLTSLTKLQKLLSSETCEALEALDAEGLRRRVIDAEAAVAESETAREADEELSALKEQAKEAAAPYKETIKYQRAIQRYCHLMMEAKGLA